MQLLQGRQRRNQLVGVLIVIAVLLLNKLGHCATMEHQAVSGKAVGDDANQPEVPLAEETIVKKELNDNLNEKQIKTNNEISAAVAAAATSLSEKPNINEQKQNVTAVEQTNKKTVITNSRQPTSNKTSSTGTQHVANTVKPKSSSSASVSAFVQHPGESILDNNEEISDSLKAGFYFFVALSFSAISFIVFKVYRLRLTRAERKYGVQGDRSTQELTPLPMAIDDGPSDDEDQTLFEVHRQNIRIL